MKILKECIGCGSNRTKSLLAIGPQPPSNRYHLHANEVCETHSLTFDACSACGLAQLNNPMPPQVVRSRFDWLTYNEPEGHLDDLLDFLASKTVLSATTHVTGISYKDDTTLARFNRKGINKTSRLSQIKDLGVSDPLASLETIQGSLTPELAEGIAKEIGKVDILLVRHILEHAHEPRRFLEACKRLCKQGGLMVFEVPDCRKVFDGHDHCFLWEEHISYFAPDTLRGFLNTNGFDNVDIRVFPYPMEDSLIAIVRNEHSSSKNSAVVNVDSELMRLEKFANSYSERGKKIKKYLQSLKIKGQRVALFGAGHLAAKFINFYDLADCLVGVIDDNSNKLGRFMPGSKLPIISSSCLDNNEIDLCLLTLNPESEQKVLRARSMYVENGGKFRSIFSASANSIDKDLGSA